MEKKRSYSIIIFFIGIVLLFYGCNPSAVRKNDVKERSEVVKNLIKDAKKLLKEGDCKGATRQLEKALIEDSGDPDVNYLLGASNYMCKRYKMAREFWDVAIDLRSEDAVWVSKVKTAIAFTYEIEGESEKAADGYMEAYELDEGNQVAAVRVEGASSSIILDGGKGKKGRKKKGTYSTFKDAVEDLIFEGIF